MKVKKVGKPGVQIRANRGHLNKHHCLIWYRVWERGEGLKGRKSSSERRKRDGKLKLDNSKARWDLSPVWLCFTILMSHWFKEYLIPFGQWPIASQAQLMLMLACVTPAAVCGLGVWRLELSGLLPWDAGAPSLAHPQISRCLNLPS